VTTRLHAAVQWYCDTVSAERRALLATLPALGQVVTSALEAGVYGP